MLVDRKSLEFRYLLTAAKGQQNLKLTLDALGLVHHELLLDLVAAWLKHLLAGLAHRIRAFHFLGGGLFFVNKYLNLHLAM